MRNTEEIAHEITDTLNWHRRLNIVIHSMTLVRQFNEQKFSYFFLRWFYSEHFNLLALN